MFVFSILNNVFSGDGGIRERTNCLYQLKFLVFLLACPVILITTKKASYSAYYVCQMAQSSYLHHWNEYDTFR